MLCNMSYLHTHTFKIFIHIFGYYIQGAVSNLGTLYREFAEVDYGIISTNEQNIGETLADYVHNWAMGRVKNITKKSEERQEQGQILATVMLQKHLINMKDQNATSCSRLLAPAAD